MRFRSGTLEKSVRRWGRMPRFGGKLQRVAHAWKYVVTEETAVSPAAATPVDLVLCDNTDWAPTATSGIGVKNMALDLHIGITWSPSVAGTLNVFNSSGIKLGIFCLDGDETAPGNMDNVFADTRALTWRYHCFNLQQMTTTSIVPQERSINWRIRARQRYMKFEEELRLLTQFDQDVSGVITDARISIFGRMSWEVP